MGLDSPVGRLRGLQRLVALLVCLLLAFSLLPVGSAQAVPGEALSPEMLVWVATEPLEANTTTLLATAELAHLDKNTGPVHFSLIHSGKGWNFTAEATDKVPAEGENTTVQIHARPPADANEGDRARAVLMVKTPGEPSSDPVFLWFETPPVSSSLETTQNLDRNEDKVNEALHDLNPSGRWAVVENVVEGTKEGAEHAMGVPPDDMPDEPYKNPGPSDSSSNTLDWAEYVADTAEEAYGDTTANWPQQVVPKEGQSAGNHEEVWNLFDVIQEEYDDLRRQWPESTDDFGVEVLDEKPGPLKDGQSVPPLPEVRFLQELQDHLPVQPPPPPPNLPMEFIGSTLVGPRPIQATTPADTDSGSIEELSTIRPGVQAAAEVTDHPAVNPSSPGGSQENQRSDPAVLDQEREGQLNSNVVEPHPAPFTPISAALLVAGFGVGALLGIALVRPESLFTRFLTKIVTGVGLTRLFSRTTGPDVLKHPLRAQIYELISNEPGITISTLACKIGAHRSTVRDHLNTLRKENLVRARSKGKACHIYPNGSEEKIPVAPREVFFYKHRGKLAKEILSWPGRIQKELATAVELPPSRIGSYTKSLIEKGLVEVKRDGKHVRYYPTPALRSLEKEILAKSE